MAMVCARAPLAAMMMLLSLTGGVSTDARNDHRVVMPIQQGLVPCSYIDASDIRHAEYAPNGASSKDR